MFTELLRQFVASYALALCTFLLLDSEFSEVKDTHTHIYFRFLCVG